MAKLAKPNFEIGPMDVTTHENVRVPKKAVKGLSIGDNITVTMKGKIVEITAREGMENGSIEISDPDVTIEKIGNDFAALAED